MGCNPPGLYFFCPKAGCRYGGALKYGMGCADRIYVDNASCGHATLFAALYCASWSRAVMARWWPSIMMLGFGLSVLHTMRHVDFGSLVTRSMIGMVVGKVCSALMMWEAGNVRKCSGKVMRWIMGHSTTEVMKSSDASVSSASSLPANRWASLLMRCSTGYDITLHMEKVGVFPRSQKG